MNKPSIIHIVGNRPQFIKLAVLYNAIAKQTSLQQYIIHTGQHFSASMSNIFFDDLFIPAPDFQLKIEAESADEYIGNASEKIRSLLSKNYKQDLVVVYGDTNSTLAGAIAARRNGNLLVHCESGVRTNDNTMPEELNRILTDRLSNVHYCCTEKNIRVLKDEGYGSIIPSQVIWSGDIMLDAFLKISSSKKRITNSPNYIACTIHRASNVTNEKNLKEIVSALNKIHQDNEVIIPLHPHTAKRLEEFGIQLRCTIIEPLGYQEMKRFLCESDYIITDSGGVCREAFFAKKVSLIIMEYPVWPEILDAAAALNCKPLKDELILNFNLLKTLKPQFDNKIFGEGNAAEIMADHLNSLVANR